MNVVAARLLDIDILAGLASPNGHQGMPVVWCGYRNGVEVLVVQRFADVLYRFWLVAAFLVDLLDALVEGSRIGVDQVGDLNSLHAGEFFDVLRTSAVQACKADSDGVIGAEHNAAGLCSRDGDRGGAGQHLLQEGTTRLSQHERSFQNFSVIVGLACHPVNTRRSPASTTTAGWRHRQWSMSNQ